jgi:ceramide glucosyltransferase
MLSAILTAVLAVPLAVHWTTHLLAATRGWRRSGATDPRLAVRPHVSLVRPICGVDAFDRETLASSFVQDYPDYDVFFCAASEADPAVALARELVAAHPEVPAQVLVGDDQISGNPKLNNVVKGYRASTADWVVMTDSNLLLGPDYLTVLADTWRPDTGLVSAPAMGDRPENFWGAVECAFLNSCQARWQLAADALGTGFAQGKTLFWSRAVLDAGGGLEALGRNLAEDVASTKLVRRQGLRVRLPMKLFAQPIGRRTAREVWGRQLRWSRVRRDGFPVIFAAEIVQGPFLALLALCALVALGAAPGWSLALLALVWYGPELWLARAQGWPAGSRDLAAMLLRDALLPAVWIATFGARGFTWRGTAMSAEEVPDPEGDDVRT